MNVCVYCSSSNAVAPVYLDTATDLGHRLADAGHQLIYGGGNVGLMGRLAQAVHARDGRVFGVIPEALKRREGIAYDVADELVVTNTMQERKTMLYLLADAFLVLPGGFGTLEELMEVLTLKQLGYHQKPIVLVDTEGYWQPLLAVFHQFYEQRFASPKAERLYRVAPTPSAALAHLDAAVPSV